MDLGVCWVGGGLLWIPLALSTLKPATSPRLSDLKLNFTHAAANRTVIKNAGNDLRRIADEVTRIEREFEGVVNVVVLRDPWFEAALDTLNVRFHFRRVTDTSDPVDLFLFIPCRSFGIEIVEMGSAVCPFNVSFEPTLWLLSEVNDLDSKRYKIPYLTRLPSC